MYWRHSKSGVYTVKSGYALAKQRKKKLQSEKGKQEESSTEPKKDKVWKGLWNLNIKYEHKHFLWKCLQAALPVQESIFHRTKMGDPMSRCCGDEVESLEHMFFSCTNCPTDMETSTITVETPELI